MDNRPPDQRICQESTAKIVHLADPRPEGDTLKTLCGLIRPRRRFDEIPERLCLKCDRAATRKLGAHRHWINTSQGWRLKWPHVVWTSGAACCDLMQNSTSGNNYNYIASVVWSSGAE